MSELNTLLKDINGALASTSESLERLSGLYSNSELDEVPESKQIHDYLFSEAKKPIEKVSLLSLKNGSMLGYINSLMMLIGNRLDEKCKEPTSIDARERSIQHRVVLERGVKPLEKKLSYQLDKLTRAYVKMEKEYKDAEKRALERSTLVNNGGNTAESEEDDDSEEEMAYRPNTTGIISANKKPSHRAEEVSTEENNEANGDSESGIYRPPKIAAALPPQQTHFEDRFDAREHKDRSNKSRMQAMEEYIRESSDQPDWSTSIGADIVNHGRGGIKSSRDTEKERKVTSFEEDNFTRLNITNKTDKRKQKQRERNARVNVIGGEDFGIFSSKRKLEDSTSRRGAKKTRSAWDRAQRRL
ncbi:lcp5p [Saccharomyces arboricola H-6]|uniref:Lcp5p n=1 Tax=Saccharomyces arboricola (strain H-6 / AS 2.3317 / CBS 10644) TaxID=1160507 RepID=J8Q2W2_SACAR|nr:lcp5p [Saccharomyces arboricola H-6]